jgi:hypothetical protein
MKQRRTETACRVCGCAEHNACDEGCSWVSVEKDSPPLCSACSGKPTDMIEVCRRIRAMFRNYGFCADTAQQANVILTALGSRATARLAAEERNPDRSWGGR